MNIDEFKSSISQNPLLDATRYTVQITGPPGTLDRQISMNCSSVSLPGRGFSTVERANHGPLRKVPYSEIYDDITTEFYATGSLKEREYINKWQLKIGGEKYYFSYYKDFIGSVLINVQNKRDQNTYTMELFEAWPISMTEVQLGYTEEGVVPVFSVSWSFHHWETK